MLNFEWVLCRYRLFPKIFEEAFESMWTQAAQERAKIYYTYRP